MLDTNTVKYLLKRQYPKARQNLEAVRGEDEVYISAITEAEIRYGLAKRPMKAEVREQIERFTKLFSDVAEENPTLSASQINGLGESLPAANFLHTTLFACTCSFYLHRIAQKSLIKKSS